MNITSPRSANYDIQRGLQSAKVRSWSQAVRKISKADQDGLEERVMDNLLLIYHAFAMCSDPHSRVHHGPSFGIWTCRSRGCQKV